jgi:hypothetical protein
VTPEHSSCGRTWQELNHDIILESYANSLGRLIPLEKTISTPVGTVTIEKLRLELLPVTHSALESDKCWISCSKGYDSTMLPIKEKRIGAFCSRSQCPNSISPALWQLLMEW